MEKVNMFGWLATLQVNRAIPLNIKYRVQVTLKPVSGTATMIMAFKESEGKRPAPAQVCAYTVSWFVFVNSNSSFYDALYGQK